MVRLLLATSNQAKVSEYMMLFQDLPCELVTLAEQAIPAVAETGSSLEENARLKAVAYAAQSPLPALADDSGLEVDALGGEPGPLSRRYAGDNASDKERNEYLLSKLRNVPWEGRGARFRCIIAVATPEGTVKTVEGVCDGVIAFDYRGGSGFGYDPIFYLPQLDRHMAELTLDEKNEISHRARAAQRALPILEKLGYR